MISAARMASPEMTRASRSSARGTPPARCSSSTGLALICRNVRTGVHNVFVAPVNDAPTLDGMAYFAAQYPDEWAGIQWLRANVPGLPVIAS